MARIFAAAADLFFAERLGSALTQLGYQPEVADLSAGKPTRVPADAHLAVIDLEGGDVALALIRQARAAGVPVLAFGPHTDAALRRAALQEGAVKAVAKSKLTADFPSLVAACARQA